MVLDLQGIEACSLPVASPARLLAARTMSGVLVHVYCILPHRTQVVLKVGVLYSHEVIRLQAVFRPGTTRRRWR